VLGTIATRAASSRADELGASALTSANDIFVHGQAAAFHAAIVIASLAFLASVTLVRGATASAPRVAAAPDPRAGAVPERAMVGAER
jgi:hypothetical protein